MKINSNQLITNGISNFKKDIKVGSGGNNKTRETTELQLLQMIYKFTS